MGTSFKSGSEEGEGVPALHVRAGPKPMWEEKVGVERNRLLTARSANNWAPPGRKGLRQ